MNASLQEEHEALLQFLYLAPIGLIQAHRSGEIVLINSLCVQLLLPQVREAALVNVFDALGDVAPDLRSRVKAVGETTGVVCENVRVTLPGADGSRRSPLVLAITLVLLEGGRLMVVLQDVTLTVRREQALREREAWFNAILTGIRDYALVHLDADGHVAHWNESIGRVTGHREAEVVGRPYTLFQTEDSVTAHALRDRLHEADADGWSMEEGWRLRADGSRFWASAMLAPLTVSGRRDPTDVVPATLEPRAYSLILRDISDRREGSEALRRATRCDQLTGLFNRHAFFEAADLELARWRREPRPLSLVIFDADHFKQVNDRHGHPVGDRVLQRIAGAMLSCFRDIDTVARLGGEEFVVLLPATNLDDAWSVAERCRAVIDAAAVVFGSGSIRVTVSGGVATLGDGASDLDGLVRQADRALYRAKALGRNRIETPPPDSETGEAAPSALEAHVG